MNPIFVPEIPIAEKILRSALRRNGLADPFHVRVAILEENGSISVIPKSPQDLPRS